MRLRDGKKAGALLLAALLLTGCGGALTIHHGFFPAHTL